MSFLLDYILILKDLSFRCRVAFLFPCSRSLVSPTEEGKLLSSFLRERKPARALCLQVKVKNPGLRTGSFI